jgi:CTP synthase
MPEQRSVTSMGGTMRLGWYPCLPLENTLAMKAYQKPLVTERHRHRFEVNNDYREALESSGLVVSGVSPDGRLVETTEVKEQPFMLGVQFHPEFQSRPNRPHPLFSSFVGAAKQTIREGTQRPLPLESA